MNEKFSDILHFLIVIFVLRVTCISSSFMIESSFKPLKPQVIALDCFKQYSNIYFDLSKRDWVSLKYSKCLNTEKDVLSLCQRVYPQLNVVNIVQSEKYENFKVWQCDDYKSDPNAIKSDEASTQMGTTCTNYTQYSVMPYECLHGEFRSQELFIPKKCHFQHLFSNDGCKSNDHWRLLSSEKCKSLGLELNTSMLLQWCDAFKNGISTFKGIEFICCPSNFDVTENVDLTALAKANTDKNSIFYKPIQLDEAFKNENLNLNDKNSKENQVSFQNRKNSSQRRKSYEVNKLSIDKENIRKSSAHMTQKTNEINKADDNEQFEEAKMPTNESPTNSKTKFLSACGVVLTILVLLVLFFNLRKKWRKRPAGSELASICPSSNDQHVNNMQINGYENPTYKLYEGNVLA